MMIWQSVKRIWAHIDKDAGRECCTRPLHLINGEFPRTQPKEAVPQAHRTASAYLAERFTAVTIPTEMLPPLNSQKLSE